MNKVFRQEHKIGMMDKDKFRQAVYEIVAAIPEGKVFTYGEIAMLAGYPGYHRLVGHILHGVSQTMGLPCHRVVNSQGRLAPAWPEQKELLKKEGVQFKSNGCVDMKEYGWKPLEDE